MASTTAITPAVMAPTFVDDFAGDVVGEDVGWVVCVTIEPDWVTVKVGGFPVAMGPAVADPTAGVLAVAPPRADPPIMDWTGAGTS